MLSILLFHHVLENTTVQIELPDYFCTLVVVTDRFHFSNDYGFQLDRIYHQTASCAMQLIS